LFEFVSEYDEIEKSDEKDTSDHVADSDGNEVMEESSYTDGVKLFGQQADPLSLFVFLQPSGTCRGS